MKYLTILMMIASIFSSCLRLSKKQKKITRAKTEQTIVGNDADSNGCKASTGYCWSIIKKKCIRVWELEIQLQPISNELGYIANASITISNDNSMAELFVPGEKISKLLQKKTQNTYQGSGYELAKVKNRWLLQKNGVLMYKE